MRETIARLVDWMRRDKLDRELKEELEFHHQQLERDLKGADAVGEVTSQRAARKIGNVTSVREAARERWSIPWMDNLQQDVRYSLRGLRRNPGFTVVVVLTLSLGLGANAAVFSMLSRVFREAPEGVRDGASLRRLYVAGKYSNARDQFDDTYSYPQWVDMQSVMPARAVTVFADDSAHLDGEKTSENIGVDYIDAAYWNVLGVPLALGRPFTKDEARIETATRLAVISHKIWQRRFAGDNAVLGKTIRVSGSEYVIVGVAAPDFRGTELSVADIWLPLGALPMDEGEPGRYWYHVRGWPRLRAITRMSSNESEAPLNSKLTTAYRAGSVAGGYPGDTAIVVKVGPINRARGPIKSGRAIDISTRLAVVSALVLLIACANVANLLLSRLLDRRRELAVRLALGISRARLTTQMFIEMFVLAQLSAIAALLAASWVGDILRRVLMPGTIWTNNVIDVPIAVAVVTAASVAAVALSILPLIHVSRFAASDALKSGSRAVADSRSTFRHSLVVVQAAMAVVLLMGAGLCIRTLQQVMSVQIGYDLNRVAFAQAILLGERGGQSSSRPGELDLALRREAERLRTVAGVQSVALATHAPIGSVSMITLRVDGLDSIPMLNKRPPGVRSVSAEYWNAIDATAVRGRLFNQQDVDGAQLVAVVSETMARVAWNGADPLGHCVSLYTGNSPCRTVVGVIRDAHWGSVIEPSMMQVYIPLSQSRQNGEPGKATTLVVRSSAQQLPMIVANLSRSLSTTIPNSRIVAQTLQQKLAPQYQPWKLSAALFSVLGGLGLAVASIGLYGVIAYGVRTRTRELGIRAALGAERSRILRMVLQQGVMTTAVGSVIGVLLAAVLSRFVASLLYETSPRDTTVTASVLGLMLVTAILASLVPAWQAARVSPMTALRSD